MKKDYFLLVALLLTGTACFAQLDVQNPGSGGPLGNGSWLRFTSGGDPTSIQENWGLNLSGTNAQPVKIINTSLLVGYRSAGYSVSFDEGNALISGKIGIGTLAPVTPLDIAGNQTLRNYQNVRGAGASIHFTSYGSEHKGPMIRSYLENAEGDNSVSRLVLSSYASGYQNELTLNNGRVGIGTMVPDATLMVKGTIHAQEVKVDLNVPGPDYVFEKAYALRPLSELQKFVKQNRHLPEVASANTMAKDGINIIELNMVMLKKIEELTLYLLEKDREIKKQRSVSRKQQLLLERQQKQLTILSLQIKAGKLAS
jgi:hypothetical protein